MKTKLLFLLLPLFLLDGAEFKLTDRGKPVCSIVIDKQAGPVEKHAASELRPRSTSPRPR